MWSGLFGFSEMLQVIILSLVVDVKFISVEWIPLPLPRSQGAHIMIDLYANYGNRLLPHQVVVTIYIYGTRIWSSL